MNNFIYFFLRKWAKIVFYFFAKRIDISGIENIPSDKPILFASIHPNSFFDAIVLHVMLKRYVYALARGDAFKKGFVEWILTVVHMIPIYRISEGKENLLKNDDTFERCQELFRKNQQVLIFAEGICKQQREVLPLKKGTARMVMQAWEEGDDVHVVPVGIMYDDFRKYGKRIKLNFNKPITQKDFQEKHPAKFVREFNEKLQPAMQQMVDLEVKPYSFFKNPIYYPALFLNAPFLILIRKIVSDKFGKTVFYDSVFYGAMFVLLPFYWLIVALLMATFLS